MRYLLIMHQNPAEVTPTDRSHSGTISLPSSDAAEQIRRKLIEDFGMVQVDRVNGKRIFRSRIELLYETIDPKTATLVLDWLTSARRGSINTKRNYVDDIRRVWAPVARDLGHERFFVGCLTHENVRSWRLAMEARGASNRTIARYLNTLSSLHRYAAMKSPSIINPVTEDDRPAIDRGNTATSTPVLEVRQVQALAAVTESQLDVLVVKLLYTLAGRVTEMCTADVEQVTRRDDRTYLKVRRKGGKSRDLPLPEDVSRQLAAHVDDRRTGPLLLNGKGERLNRHNIDSILTRLGHRARTLTCPAADSGERHNIRACKACRDVTPHVLRASRITHMLDAGIPLAEVQAFADHENPATTVGYWERRQKNTQNAKYVDDAARVFTSVPDNFTPRETP